MLIKYLYLLISHFCFIFNTRDHDKLYPLSTFTYSGRSIIFLIFKISELFFFSLCYCHCFVACYFLIDFRISLCGCLCFAPVFLPNIVCGWFAHSSIYSEVASHVNDAVFLKCLSVGDAVGHGVCYKLQHAACVEHL